MSSGGSIIVQIELPIVSAALLTALGFFGRRFLQKQDKAQATIDARFREMQAAQADNRDSIEAKIGATQSTLNQLSTRAAILAERQDTTVESLRNHDRAIAQDHRAIEALKDVVAKIAAELESDREQRSRDRHDFDEHRLAILQRVNDLERRRLRE